MAIPKHIAISLDDIHEWCSRNNIDLHTGCGMCFGHLNKLLQIQARLGIQIMTIYLLPENSDKSGSYMVFSDCMADFFNNLSQNDLIRSLKIKISVFGKWYNLPGRSVESLKNIIELTKDHDGFFANFCINYDGQEEIVDACRLAAKQVELGKINPEMITKESIKENMYSSNFIPPDIILIYGEGKLSGLLLWDSVNSKIAFAGKPFMDFDEGDLEKFIE